MDFAEYKAIQAINASAIKAGVISMKHMRAEMTGKQKEQTPAMRWGKLVHMAVMEHEKFLGRVAVFQGAAKRGKAWDEFKDQHDEDYIVTGEESEELIAIYEAVSSNKSASEIISASTAEITIEWDDPDYGKAKARLDGYSKQYGVLEVKTTSKITPGMFAKQFVGMGYDLQCGWYCDGVKALGMSKNTPDCLVIAIESEHPFDVAVYEVPSTVIRVGALKARKIARAYRQAEYKGVFAGVSEGITELVVPSWYGENDVMEAFAEMSASEL